MAAAIQCKRQCSQASIRETAVSKSGKAKTSEARTRSSCIAETHESTKQRTESVTKRIHEEHIAGKGQNIVLRYNSMLKFIPMPQAMLIPDAKAAVDKEWKEVKKRHTKQRKGKSTLLHWWTSATSKSTSTSRWMFARAISSVETNLCLMNYFIAYFILIFLTIFLSMELVQSLT